MMTRPPARLPDGPRISDLVTLGVLTTTVPAALINAVLVATQRQSQEPQRHRSSTPWQDKTSLDRRGPNENSRCRARPLHGPASSGGKP